MQDVKDESSEYQPDRRRFVRAQDALGLHVQRLVDLPAAGQIAVSDAPLPVRKADKYSIEGYAEVRSHFPAVAHYISDLEERIRELLLDSEAASAIPTHKVTISVGGLSFSDKSLYVPGEVISMTLTLFPTGKRIGTDAVVISANDADEVLSEDQPTYRVEFLRMSDNDRRVIELHVDQLLSKRTRLDYS